MRTYVYVVISTKNIARGGWVIDGEVVVVIHKIKWFGGMQFIVCVPIIYTGHAVVINACARCRYVKSPPYDLFTLTFVGYI